MNLEERRGNVRMTSKFTKSFNRAASRFAFWHVMMSKLADFDGLVKNRQSLTPEDVKTLREIHIALYKCYSVSKGMAEHHKAKLFKLRDERAQKGVFSS